MSEVSEKLFEETAVVLGILTKEQADDINRILARGAEDITFETYCVERDILSSEQVSEIKTESAKISPAPDMPEGMEPDHLFDGSADDIRHTDTGEIILGYRLGLLAFEQGMISKVDYIESYYAHKFAYGNMPFEAYLIDKQHLTVEQVNHLKDIARTIDWDEYFSRHEQESDSENLTDGLKRSLDMIFKQIDEQSRKIHRSGDTIHLEENYSPLADVAWGGEKDDSLEIKGTLGDPIERYDIIDEIARGGMGVIFKARQLDLNRIVALKFMLAETGLNEDDRMRFLREAEALANLKHPNIVQIHDIGVSKEGYFFVMDYVEGMSLTEYMMVMGDQFTIRDRIRMMLKVLDAIHFGHQLGLMHRDLKPGNIMINNQGEPIVVDFGLVEDNAALSSTIRTEEIMGTPYYMAPEQVNGLAEELGPSTDVFALGVVLYELLTENLPFSGDNLDGILHAVAEKTPLRPSEYNTELDPEIEAIIFKALEKKSEHRYTTVLDFKEDLQRYLDAKPIYARKMSRVYYAVKYLKKNRPAAILLLSVFFLIAVGIVWGVLLFRYRAERIRNTAYAELKNIKEIGKRNSKYLEQAEQYIAEADFKNAAELRTLIRTGADQIQTITSDSEVGTTDSDNAALKWEKEAEKLSLRITAAEQKALIEEEMTSSGLKYTKGNECIAKAEALVDADENSTKDRLILFKNAGKFFQEALDVYPENENARKALVNVSFSILDTQIELGDTGVNTEEAIHILNKTVQTEDEKEKLREYREKIKLTEIKNYVKRLTRKGNELFFDEKYEEALTVFRKALDMVLSEDDRIHLEWKIRKVTDVYSRALRVKAEQLYSEGEFAKLNTVCEFLFDLGNKTYSRNIKSAISLIHKTPENMIPVLAEFGVICRNGSKDSFYVSKQKISNAEYMKFVKAGGYEDSSYWSETGLIHLDSFTDRTETPGPADWSKGKYPEGEGAAAVTGISQYEARAYARWLSKTEGLTFRIPDESEWSKIYSINSVPIKESPWNQGEEGREMNGFVLIAYQDTSSGEEDNHE